VILAAFLLVLAGAGLFLAGLLTGVTLLYWICVAACGLAAVLLVVARRQMIAAPAAETAPPAGEPATRRTASSTAEAPAVAPVTTAAESATPAGGATAVGALPSDGAPEEQPPPVAELDDPPVEEVEVTDLLLVVDVTDEVLVVDERPRYHLAGCVHLVGRTPIPLPLDEAKTDGFTPCAACEPDRNLAERVRAQRGAGNR
jgi:hypothetical protein